MKSYRLAACLDLKACRRNRKLVHFVPNIYFAAENFKKILHYKEQGAKRWLLLSMFSYCVKIYWTSCRQSTLVICYTIVPLEVYHLCCNVLQACLRACVSLVNLDADLFDLLVFIVRDATKSRRLHKAVFKSLVQF